MRKIAIAFCFLFLSLGSFAQQDMMLYNMQGVPQSSYANPSNRFEGKFYVGIPGLSSNYFNFSNTVRYSDVVTKDGDSLLLSFSNLIDQMKDENYLAFNSRIDLLSFGYSITEQTQLTLNITEVASMSFDYNKDLIRFIYEGNTAFLGSSPDLGVGINASHYREYGLGASHQINNQWRVGLRLKYLYGMENIYTERSDITLITDPETYALTAKTDFKLRTAGLSNPDDEEESFMDYFGGRNNRGFGVDLGATYDLNEKFSFSASITDLGFIRWNERTKNYTSEGNYVYDGVEIEVFGENELSQEDSPFNQILDSIETELGIVEGTGAYTSPLVTKVYLGGNYHIDERSFAGLLIKNDIFKGVVKPSFSLAYGRKMLDWLTLTGGYSSINGSYDNISMGAVFDPGPAQIYIMSDNILGMFMPQHLRNVHLRFGINLIFGREKKNLKIFNRPIMGGPTASKPASEEEQEEEEANSEEMEEEGEAYDSDMQEEDIEDSEDSEIKTEETEEEGKSETNEDQQEEETKSEDKEEQTQAENDEQVDDPQ